MKKHEQAREHDQAAIIDLGKATDLTQGTPLDEKVEGINTRDFYDPRP